jgi:hypothetical protein
MKLSNRFSMTEVLEQRRVMTRTSVPDWPVPTACAHGGGCGCGLRWTDEKPAIQILDTRSSESLSVPALSSRPTATAKLYLDFDGDFTASWGPYVPGTTPAYDTDDDPTSFSTNELAEITEAWERTAEFYAPFNIDVTTINTGNLNDLQTLRVVIGGNGSWFAPAGGVAYIDAFSSPFAPNTVWTFSENLFSPGDVALVNAHEGGHGFGLLHQSEYNSSGVKINEYYAGDGSVAPHMGVAYGSPRAKWWLGPSSNSATSIQDDIALLSRPANGFGFAADDIGDTTAAAAAIGTVQAGASATGILHNTSDVDFFRVTHSGGPISAGVYRQRVSGAAVGMLDASIALFNSSGTLIASQAGPGLDEAISQNQPAGTYYIRVSSAGNYGDIGGYRLRVAPSIDVTPPTVLNKRFDFEAGPAMEYTFSEDVGSSLNASDLEVYNFTIAGWTRGATRIDYNPVTFTARFILPADLPGGDYYFGLDGLGVSDNWFNPVSTSDIVEYDYYLAGDANRNRSVEFNDLLRVAQNYGLSGRTFSQGNVDYSSDGVVGFNDLLIIAQGYGQSVFRSDPTPIGSTRKPVEGILDA